MSHFGLQYCDKHVARIVQLQNFGNSDLNRYFENAKQFPSYFGTEVVNTWMIPALTQVLPAIL